jgi:hypothetical protein
MATFNKDAGKKAGGAALLFGGPAAAGVGYAVGGTVGGDSFDGESSEAMAGMSTGAAIGTGIAPGVGTLIGAGVGYLAGGLIGGRKRKKEEEAQRKAAEAAERARVAAIMRDFGAQQQAQTTIASGFKKSTNRQSSTGPIPNPIQQTTGFMAGGFAAPPVGSATDSTRTTGTSGTF